jgi:hypothetical protein
MSRRRHVFWLAYCVACGHDDWHDDEQAHGPLCPERLIVVDSIGDTA